jgi:general stress protein 26
MQPPHEALHEKIKNIHIAMLTTHTAEGELCSRPMAIQEMQPDGSLWILTNLDGNSIEQIKKHPNVGLSFSDNGNSTYVSVSATAKGIPAKDQPEMLNKLWSDWMNAWFPNGKDDPNIAMIRMQPVRAEYWDQPGGKLVALFNQARALVTGDHTKATESNENKELTF